jgi:hypothetical protein
MVFVMADACLKLAYSDFIELSKSNTNLFFSKAFAVTAGLKLREQTILQMPDQIQTVNNINWRKHYEKFFD